jgi:6-phosphogluconolactonase
LNLTALLDSRRIVLMIGGAAKWRTYAAARTAGPEAEMPVRAVLRQSRTPVDVLWAP